MGERLGQWPGLWLDGQTYVLAGGQGFVGSGVGWDGAGWVCLVELLGAWVRG